MICFDTSILFTSVTECKAESVYGRQRQYLLTCFICLTFVSPLMFSQSYQPLKRSEAQVSDFLKQTHFSERFFVVRIVVENFWDKDLVLPCYPPPPLMPCETRVPWCWVLFAMCYVMCSMCYLWTVYCVLWCCVLCAICCYMCLGAVCYLLCATCCVLCAICDLCTVCSGAVSYVLYVVFYVLSMTCELCALVLCAMCYMLCSLCYLWPVHSVLWCCWCRSWETA